MRQRAVRPDLAPAALQRARRLAENGTPVCTCAPRAPLLVHDGVWTLTCPTCGGLDAGQLEAAHTR
jgi:hypothetical protein